MTKPESKSLFEEITTGEDSACQHCHAGGEDGPESKDVDMNTLGAHNMENATELAKKLCEIYALQEKTPATIAGLDQRTNTLDGEMGPGGNPEGDRTHDGSTRAFEENRRLQGEEGKVLTQLNRPAGPGTMA